MSDQPTPDATKPIVLKSLLDYREAADIVPMTREQSELFVHLFSAERQDEEKLTSFDRENLANNRHAALLAKMAGNFGFQVFVHRMHPTTKITVEAFLFLLDRCTSPGDVVLWCYTLHRLFQKDQELITMSTIANEWPWGFPNEAAMLRCWDAQKGGAWGVRGDNLIDDESFWN